MKSIFYIIAALLLIMTQHAFSQNIGDLNGIYYQAVAVDEEGKEIVGTDIEGKPLYNKAIGVRFSITKGLNGPVQWAETHTTTTDKYGLFTLIIGQGEVSGDVAEAGAYTRLLDIPWIDADQFLKVEIATKNDGNYKVVSNQQFMAVPYSFYTDDIADDAITTEKILDSTIINQDVAIGAIDTRTILDSTILNEDIATGSVDTRTILDSTILNEDIATGSVDSRTILDFTLLNEDMATGSVDTRTILDSTILNEDIATGSVDTRTILDSTILNEDIATGSVDTRTILDSTILNEDIATGSVDTRAILDSTILNEDMADGSVDSRTILNGSILNEDIANGTIDLTTKVTGILPVPNGGTGLNSLTQEGVLVGNGTNPITVLSMPDSGQVLTNIGGVTELYALKAGPRTTITYDDIAKTVTITALDQSSGGGIAVGTNVNTGAIPIGGQVTRVFPMPGTTTAALGDIIIASIDLDLEGVTLTAYVSNPDEVTFVFFNGTGAARNLSGFDIKIFNMGQ